jgi:hypothetical protein
MQHLACDGELETLRSTRLVNSMWAKEALPLLWQNTPSKLAAVPAERRRRVAAMVTALSSAYLISDTNAAALKNLPLSQLRRLQLHGQSQARGTHALKVLPTASLTTILVDNTAPSPAEFVLLACLPHLTVLRLPRRLKLAHVRALQQHALAGCARLRTLDVWADAAAATALLLRLSNLLCLDLGVADAAASSSVAPAAAAVDGLLFLCLLIPHATHLCRHDLLTRRRLRQLRSLEIDGVQEPCKLVGTDLTDSDVSMLADGLARAGTYCSRRKRHWFSLLYADASSNPRANLVPVAFAVRRSTLPRTKVATFAHLPVEVLSESAVVRRRGVIYHAPGLRVSGHYSGSFNAINLDGGWLKQWWKCRRSFGWEMAFSTMY